MTYARWSGVSPCRRPGSSPAASAHVRVGVEVEHRDAVRRRAPAARRACVSRTTRRAVRQHVGQPVRRVAGSSGTYAPPALSTPAARPPAPGRAPGRRHPRVRPHARARAGGAPAGSRARSAPRRSARSPSKTTATASGVARRLRLEQLVDARARAGTPPRVRVPLLAPPAPLSLRQQRQPSTGCRVVARAIASSTAAQVAPASAPRSPASNSAVAYSSPPTMRPPALAQRQRQVELRGPCAATRHVSATRSAGELRPRRPARSASANITWKSGVCARLRAGCSPLHHLLEGDVLVRCASSARAFTRASSSATVGAPERSTRSASVFTKKPISPSISRRPRFGDRRADDHVVLAREPREHRRPAGQQRHEQRGAVPLARAPSAPRSSASSSSTRTAPRRGPAPPAADGRSAAPAARARRRALARQYSRLRSQHLALDPPPLPGRVVGVLDRQRRQRVAARRGAKAA